MRYETTRLDISIHSNVHYKYVCKPLAISTSSFSLLLQATTTRLYYVVFKWRLTACPPVRVYESVSRVSILTASGWPYAVGSRI